MKKNLFFVTALLFFLFSLLFQQSVTAQTPEKIPANPIICPAKFEDMHTRINIPDVDSESLQLRLQTQATAEIIVTYGPGAQANPEAQAAFQYALDIWSNQIVSPVPIKIFADFATLGQGVLASAGPTFFVSGVPNAPDPDVLYPAALANAIAGEVLFPDEEFDLIVNLGDGIPWYFGTDGNTPAGLFDFVTVALHEACHGLGFTAIRNFDPSTGVGSIRSGGLPSIYGIFLIDGDGNYLIDFPDPSVEIGDAFTGGDLFVDGDFAKAALGGVRPEVYAPSTFQGGSSIAHWDEVAFPAGDPNSLMSPQVGSAESNHDIGDITRGHFKDMGWIINEEGAPTLIASPTSLSEELFVGEGITENIIISNISESEINATITSNSGSSTIESFSVSELSIPSTESASFDVTLNTTGLAKGIYQDTIYVTEVDTENIINIPVTVRVLDGTEVPLISVNPESFNESIEQLKVTTQTLTINNTGDDNLSFSISVNDGSVPDLASRIATSNESIRSSGFNTKRFPATETSSLSAALKTNTGIYNEVVTSLYATGFEDFTPGDINGQLGWASQFTDNWVISDSNPSDGTQHLSAVSDGLGGTRPAAVLALSPVIIPGDEPFMVASATVQIEGSGVSWEIIPQSPTAGSVNTRLRFNGDGTIDVLAGADFNRIEATTPEGYFDVRIVVDKDDSTFSIYFDNELVFAGQGFAPQIEQFVLLSDMAVEGSTMSVDNIEITDGDPDAFFLSVSPSAGIVPFGSSSAIDVKFDARSLEPGEYEANISINSNDTTNPTVNVPVTLTVLQPPTIEVAPESLSAAVDVQVDIPPVKTESFTVSNTGESPLEFSTSLGALNFTPVANTSSISVASLDMARYGEGRLGSFDEMLAGLSKEKVKTKIDYQQNDAVTFNDSIYYDSGLLFPDDFAGLNGTAPYTTALKFDVESDFTLSALRNGFRTETIADPVIIVEIYRGGATPNDGELLLTQTFAQASEEGVVVVETLDQSLNFAAGESFWVVHKYPDGIAFPQGVDSNATQRPDTYLFSGDGGLSYNPSGFVFFVRALSGGSDGNYISLEPSSGTLAPGESTIVSVTFNGETLANGTYERDILISSNDPVTPVANVATTFEVSGQISEIAVSDELLLFNDVFVGGERERTLTISNSGLAQLNISSISSDNDAFTADPSSAVVDADGTLEVTVTFAPSTLGSINGILTIESDASNEASVIVVLNGIGVDPPIAVLSPEEAFETTDAGTTVTSEVTLSNEGNSPLIFSFPDLAVAKALAKPDVQLNNTQRIDFQNFSMSQEKGFNDTRVGAEVLYNIGTDNGFGYSWIDSNEEGGPVYSFMDISGTGTEISRDNEEEGIIGTAGDGNFEAELSFPFEFYGTVNNSVIINANGFVAFQEPSSFVTWINSQIPTDDAINNMIAGMWVDLEPQNLNGSLHYQDFGDKFIVQWTTASLFSGSAEETVTFQIVLYADGNIDIFYEDVASAPFINSATVGIENADASDGAQVAFNTPYIEDGLALRFVKPDIALSNLISNVSPLSGVVPAGGSRSLKVTLDATELNDGVYYDELTVSSNDPVNEPTTLFELTVIGYPEITVTPEALDFEPIFVGLTSEASFLIENTGSKALEISTISNESSDFVLDNTGPVTIQPGNTQIIGVEFVPSTPGIIEDVITIASNDAFDNESLTISLSGEGIDPPVIEVAPTSLEVTLTEGKSAEETVSITNTGNSTLNYSLISPTFSLAGEASVEVQGYPKLEYAKIESKEALDTRVGPKFVNASGGPGTFGYTWVDSDSGGPAYDFIDISGIGEIIDVGADGNATVDLPFEFNFYGNVETSAIISANGYLTFSPITGIDFVNDPIPDEGNPNLFIAPMWADIEPQDGDGVYVFGNEEYFIVQYENVPGFGFLAPPPNPVTFQVILFPDGSFKMQYKDVENSDLRTQSTVGIEGPQGLSGLQVIFNNEYLSDNLAITFTPPVSGTVEPGETVDIPVTISADGLEPEQTYFGDIIVDSNDPITPRTTVPVTLNVLRAPEVVSFTLIDANTNDEVGLLNDGDTIDLDEYIRNRFSVVANVGTADVGSVVFDLNGVETFQIENFAPYALDGDFAGGTRYYPVEFPKGMNTITATPYSGRNGTGEAGKALTVNFEVFRTNDTEVVSFTLINTATNEEIGNLVDGDVIDLIDYPANSFSVVANVGSIDPGSVVFDFNDIERFKTENIAPYALDGDYRRRGTLRYYPVEFDMGTNTITATPYSRRRGRGEAGIALTVNFEVIDSSISSIVKGADALSAIANESSSQFSTEIKAYPNPASDYVQLSIKANESKLNGIMYDLNGRVVHKSEISLTNNVGNDQIDITRFANGIYILRLYNDSGVIVSEMKIIKH